MGLSPQELDFHMGGIGGSDAPAVMEKSPWVTPLMLWELKTRRRFSDPPNFQMIQGLKMEPIARKEYEKITGIEMPRGQVKHSSIDYVRANLDGVNWDLGRALEIKCPGKVDHALATKKLIPLKYWYQCVHICAAADLDELDYFSYYRDRTTGEVNTATVHFKRSKKTEKTLLDKEEQFWEYHVMKDIAPKNKETKMDGIFQVRQNRAPIRKTKPIEPTIQLRDITNAPAADIEEAVLLLQKAKELGAKVKINIQFDLTLGDK